MKSCLLGYPVPKEPHKLNTPKFLVMSMPETGFFFPGPFHIPHPENGERKNHLNGWMDLDGYIEWSSAFSRSIKITSLYRHCPDSFHSDAYILELEMG